MENEPISKKVVYACACTLNRYKDGLKEHQKPIKGEIREYHHGSFFYPYSKFGKLLMSKGVNKDAREYAETEEESKALYNSCIDCEIKDIDYMIERLTKEKKELEGMKIK